MAQISIIVPIYNVEKYLAKCLDSLINQTFSDIEIICVDDGSSDNSFAILSSYAAQDKRIVVYKNINSGVSVTRNKGLELASSPYIMFCDSDDYYEPNMCELMFKAIDENDVDMAMCDLYIVYPSENGNDLKKERSLGCKTGINKINDTNIDYLYHEIYIKIFRKAVLDKYHLIFPLGLWYEDIAFSFMYYSLLDNFYYINTALYNYVQQENGIMGTSRKKTLKALDHIDIMEYIYDFYVLNNKFIPNKSKYFNLFTLLFANTLYYLPSDKYHLAFKKANSFLNKVPAQYFTNIEKNIVDRLKYIKQGKDPRVIAKSIKIFNFELCKIEQTYLKRRFYLFNVRLFSMANNKK